MQKWGVQMSLDIGYCRLRAAASPPKKKWDPVRNLDTHKNPHITLTGSRPSHGGLQMKIIVYMTEEEKKQIENAAKDASLSMSTFIRTAALKEAKR